MARHTISLNVTPWRDYKTRQDHDDNLILAFSLREREVRKCFMEIRTFLLPLEINFSFIPENNCWLESFDVDITSEQAKTLSSCPAVKSVILIPESIKP